MEDKHFYITIEVTAQMNHAPKKMTADERRQVRGKVLDYIHNENQKKNHVNSSCYLYRERIMSVYDEKGESL
jgi:hypothetical protein